MSSTTTLVAATCERGKIAYQGNKKWSPYLVVEEEEEEVLPRDTAPIVKNPSAARLRKGFPMSTWKSTLGEFERRASLPPAILLFTPSHRFPSPAAHRSQIYSPESSAKEAIIHSPTARTEGIPRCRRRRASPTEKANRARRALREFPHVEPRDSPSCQRSSARQVAGPLVIRFCGSGSARVCFYFWEG